MLTVEQINENYGKFSKYLSKIVSEDVFNNIITSIGGEEHINKSPFGTTIDSGSAYDGALVENCLKIADYACKINAMLPETMRTNNQSIYKVALLSHIAKVVMYEPNDNSWEREKRGMLYKFKETDGALRCGERSILLTMNYGVKFNEYEFEAMRIMDKTKDDDNYSKFFSSVLSTVIRQANELVMIENKN